jgi:signal transduction histidine kinase
MEEFTKQLNAFKDDPCGKRMWVIYQETRVPLDTIRGFTAILGMVDPSQVPGLPENYQDMLNRIAQAERVISTILNTLALPEGKGKWTTEK